MPPLSPCQSLDGDWTLRLLTPCEGAPEALSATIRARVPGDVHSALLAEGLIPDPLVGEREAALAWISECVWEWRRSFDLAPGLTAAHRIVLHADGLDTLARVELNGVHLGDADNMHRSWEWDVTPLARERDNELVITFQPVSTEIARQRAIEDAHAHERSLVTDRSWVRKACCGFGWDWAPRFVTCGIWRSLRLQAMAATRIDAVQTDQTHHDDGAVTVGVDVELTTDANDGSSLTVAASLTRHGEAVATIATPAHPGDRTRLELHVAEPALWWTHDLGEPALYTLSVQLRQAERDVGEPFSLRLGLRRVELVCARDAIGESFGFRLNGRDLFARGANWIPADVFFSQVTAARRNDLLEAAQRAHHNMLRVWGGGIYEDDHFYDRCDELGILVWQDCAFACATYPVFSDAWRNNVATEISQNVRRLRHHACLALWCGNNEVQGYAREQWQAVDGRWSSERMAVSAYHELFRDLIGGIVAREDPQRPYWPGSPTHPDRIPTHHNLTHGDDHYWIVFFDGFWPEDQRRVAPRFVSEFGFQSAPELPVFQRKAEARRNELTPGELFGLHQRCRDGGPTIERYVTGWFGTCREPARAAWLSQIFQGLVHDYAVRHWRTQPACRGVLYWQFNDAWAGNTWSTIDGLGRAKASLYITARAYTPVMVAIFPPTEEGPGRLHLVNDGAAAVSAMIAIEVRRLDDGAVVTRDMAQVALAAGERWEQKLAEDLVHPVREDASGHALRAVVRDAHGTILTEDCQLAVRPHALRLPPPEVAIRDAGTTADHRVLEVTSARPVLWFTLRSRDGHNLVCSDNAVHLFPGETRRLSIRPAGEPLDWIALGVSAHQPVASI